MSGTIRIRVVKKNVPPGTVLLEDVAALASGVHDALARLVQHRLGYVGRGRLPSEAKKLAPVVLVGVSQGSGVLECQPIDIHIAARNPALLAATELVDAINVFAATGSWPSTLPGVVRNRIGAAVRPVLTPESGVQLLVTEDGRSSSCYIDPGIEEALQEPETFATTEPVQLTGKVFDINVKSRTLKIDAVAKTVTVPFKEEQLEVVDELRWQRAQIKGFPADDRLTRLASIVEIRKVGPDDVDGIIIPSELKRGEATAAYRDASRRLGMLSELEQGWDSYSAPPPHPATLKFSTGFIRDIAGVLVDYGIDPPIPFVTATPHGGIQFEWTVENRELELEVARPNDFHYLRVGPNYHDEGTASRWEAVRFVKWVASGEEP